ncbi:MAG: hypothetical protein HFI08_02550 [Bacilli bacterium]|nr:hypothetical protein [Bacilli bacterium]
MKKVNIKFIFIIVIGFVFLVPNVVDAGACTTHANTTFRISRKCSGKCDADKVLRSNGAIYYMRRYTVSGYQTYCMDPGNVAPQNGETYRCFREVTPESNSEGIDLQAFDVAATWAYQYMVGNGLINPTNDNRVIGELVFRWLWIVAYHQYSPDKLKNDDALDIFERGPAAFSQKDSRVAIATNIYNSAVSVGNRIKNGDTYEQLVEEGVIWGDSWNFQVIDSVPNGTNETMKIEVSPKGSAPATIYFDLFETQCTNGVVCTVVDRQVNGTTAILTVNIDRSQSTGPYEMTMSTPYSDSRSGSANIMMLYSRKDRQRMIVIADSNLPITPPVTNGPPTTYHTPRHPVPSTPQCIQKADGKYYYNGKEVTKEEDMVKYSCPVYCQMFPDSTRTDEHYGWADRAHFGTEDNGGKHYFNRVDYQKYCNTKCQIVDHVYHCGPDYIAATGKDDDTCTSAEYNHYCENDRKVCKHEGDTYYCKNGETCNSDKYFEECCDQIDPDSDDYKKYCSCGNADIEFIGACTEFNSTNENLVNHVADVPNDAKLKYCLFNPSSKDKANNAYQMTDQTTVVNNPYCKVSCIEKFEFILPNSQYTVSGSYFTLQTKIEGVRKCYVNGQSTYEGIDKEKFLQDLLNASKQLAAAQSEYNKVAQGIANITSEEKGCEPNTIYFNNAYTYKSCEATRNGDNISLSCKDVNVSQSTWTDGEKSGTHSCGPDGGTCCSNDGSDGTYEGIKSDILGSGNSLDSYKSKITQYTNEVNKILQQYDDCTNGWKNQFNFDPLVQFEYDEPYQTMQGFNNKFEQVDKSTLEESTYCNGVGDNYACSSKDYKTYEQSYVVCSGEDNASCAVSTKTLSSSLYHVKTEKVEATYKPKNQFSIYTPAGTIALDRGNYVLYTGLCGGSQECLPIALNTHTGVFNFKFRYSQIGQFNDNNQVGRLVGEGKSVYSAVSSQKEAGYVCHYVNNCPDCDYTCVGDNCTIEEDCDGECTYVCQNCIFDGENSTFYYRTVSINNLFPNSREYGPNWNNVKGNYTKKVVEEKGESVYETPEYSYTINAQQMNRIREFNKSVGDYLNTKMPNGDDSLICHDLSSNGKNYPNIYCLSAFLDTAGNTYFKENKRNDIWTLWPDSGYFTNNTKYSVSLGMGPAWK